MKTVLTFIFCSVLIPAFLLAQNTKYEEQDPFLGNYIVGNNAEIQIVSPSIGYPPNYIPHYGFSYDWESNSLDSILAIPTDPYFAFGPQFDIATGDFDGDQHDDLVVATGYTGLAAVKLVIDGPHSLIAKVLPGFNNQTPEGSSILHLTAGDFDQDPQKEIALAYQTTTGKIWLGLYETDSSMSAIKVLDQIEDLDLEIETDMSFDNHWLRFDIAAGDYDGDGLDEVALVKYKELSQTGYGLFGIIKLNAKIYDVNPDNKLDTSADTDTISVVPLFFTRAPMSDGLIIESTDLDNDNMDEVVIGCTIYRGGDPPLKESSTIVAWDPKADSQGPVKRLTKSGSNPQNPLNLICADLNMDGKDEIIISEDGTLTRIIQVEPGLTFQQVGEDIWFFGTQWLPNSFYGSQFLAVADLDADESDMQADSIWLPEIVAIRPDLQEIKVFQPQLDANNNVTGLIHIDSPPYPQKLTEYDIQTFAIMPADRDGDGLRLGKPKRLLVESVIEPLLILNAPPVHFDIFDRSYDICQVYNQYSGQEEFMTVYGLEQNIQTTFQHRTHSDWGLSNSLSVGYEALGYGAEVFFNTEYGQYFEKTSMETQFIQETTKKTSKIDDLIFANKMDYGLWEYPVYFEGEKRGDILAVIPHQVNSIWLPAKDDQSGRYIRRNHEPGNILSYPHYSDPGDNPELGTLVAKSGQIVVKDATHQWGIQTGNISEQIDENEWHSQMSWGASSKSPVHSHSFEAKYSLSEISTHALKIDKTMYFESFLGSIDQSYQNQAPYNVELYIYKARSGAFVLDFLVSPDESAGGAENFWLSHYGDKPDLTFNLPWKYDTEKGTPVSDYYRNKTREIVITPRYPAPGDTVLIKAIIHNYSLQDVLDTVKVRFYLGDPDAGGIPITGLYGEQEVYNAKQTGVAARDSVKIQMWWKVPDDISSNPLIYAVVDSENKIDEIHEDGYTPVNNNKGWIELEIYPITSIKDSDTETQPLHFTLYQNYPNPFNPATKIKFTLPHTEKVKIEVFDILGRKITTLMDQRISAGHHQLDFNASEFASGIYFYRIKAGSFQRTKKMFLLK